MATSLKKSDFPESVHGLINKSKTELLNIIARKDDVEGRLNDKIKELNKQIEDVNSVVDVKNHTIECNNETIKNQAKIIEKCRKSTSEANTAVDIANETIAQLKTEYWRLHKDFNYLLILVGFMFIALVIMVIQ